MRSLLFALLSLASFALGHAEPVTAQVTLWTSGKDLYLSVALVGKHSGQPVLGARIEGVLLEVGTPLEDGVVRGLPRFSGVVARRALREVTPGVYTAQLPDPPATCVLVLADTSFPGETVLASAPVHLPLPPGGAALTLVFPATPPPTAPLARALAWLWLPVLIGAGAALTARGPGRVYSRQDA